MYARPCINCKHVHPIGTPHIDYDGRNNAERELDQLRTAVREFLTDWDDCDLSGVRLGWPKELEKLSGWEEPSGS